MQSASRTIASKPSSGHALSTRASQLATLERVLQELACCDSLAEVKDYRDKAESLRIYARNAKVGLDVQNKAAEVRLRAERKAGEMLAEMKLRGGDHISDGPSSRPQLSEFDITHNQSTRWQKLASIPEDDFSHFVVVANERQVEITAVGVLRAVAVPKRSRTTRAAPPRDEGLPAPTAQTSARSAAICVADILSDLQNHCTVFDGILSQICESRGPVELKLVQKQHLRTLVREFKSLIGDLEQLASPQLS